MPVELRWSFESFKLVMSIADGDTLYGFGTSYKEILSMRKTCWACWVVERAYISHASRNLYFCHGKLLYKNLH